jgi:hypothetical protein
MTSTPPATAPPTKAEKPTLTGSRIKQRKVSLLEDESLAEVGPLLLTASLLSSTRVW